MATIFGGLGFWGFDSEQANGIIGRNVSCEMSEESVFLPDHVGDDKAGAFFNQQGSMTVDGATVTEHTSGQTLGSALSNANEEMFTTDSDLTIMLIERVSFTSANRGFQEGSYSAISRAGITSGVGVEVT